MKYFLILLSILGLILLGLQFSFVFNRTTAKFVGVHDIRGFDVTEPAANGSNTTRFDSLFNNLYTANKVQVDRKSVV